VAYSHVVFTLPHELIPLARQNPTVVYNIFFRAVSQALLTIAADPRHLGARLGFLAVLHTWNQKLLAHRCVANRKYDVDFDASSDK
jgi:hypothetical protein